MPRRTSQGTTKGALTKRRFKEADVRFRIYVRPFGDRGLHVVKNRINGVEYKVAGPSKTFAPGTIVPTGSYTSTQGEVIISQPPPGRRGASRYPPGTTTIIDPPRPIVPEGPYQQPLNGTTAGYQSQWYFPGSGFSPLTYLEPTLCTNRAGNSDPGFTVLLGTEYISSTLLRVTTTTTESFAGDGDEDDPHPQATWRVYSQSPPYGQLAGIIVIYFIGI